MTSHANCCSNVLEVLPHLSCHCNANYLPQNGLPQKRSCRSSAHFENRVGGSVKPCLAIPKAASKNASATVSGACRGGLARPFAAYRDCFSARCLGRLHGYYDALSLIHGRQKVLIQVSGAHRGVKFPASRLRQPGGAGTASVAIGWALSSRPSMPSGRSPGQLWRRTAWASAPRLDERGLWGLGRVHTTHLRPALRCHSKPQGEGVGTVAPLACVYVHCNRPCA